MADDLVRRFRDLNPVPDPDGLVEFGTGELPIVPIVRVAPEPRPGTAGHARTTARDGDRPLGSEETSPTNRRSREMQDVRTKGAQELRERRNKSAWLVAGASVAAMLLVGVIVFFVARDEVPVAATPSDVATSFLEAFGAHDAERAITYLADDADIKGLIGTQDPEGTLEEFRRVVQYLEGQGYEQTLHPCVEREGSTGTTVRCPFDYQAIRSGEMGLGPYTGSHFEIRVRDGKVLWAWQEWDISQFSSQVWGPFASWVASEHPEDAEVMYEARFTRWSLSEESIRLWEQHSREYVEHVRQQQAST